jgi:hypothetical protein
MDITREQFDIIFKHDGVEIVGVRRHIWLLWLSLCVSLLCGTILWKLEIMVAHDAILSTSVSFLSVFAVAVLFDFLYLRMYRKYISLKDAAQAVVRSNTPNNRRGLGDLSDMDFD